MTKPSLTLLASAAAALAALAVALIFFVAPEDADQGLSQKIFYVHVPIALTAYACFGLAAWKAFRLLTTRSDLYGAYAYPQDPAFGTQQGILVFNTESGGWDYDQQQSLEQGDFACRELERFGQFEHRTERGLLVGRRAHQ